jgi:hypothetical protein
MQTVYFSILTFYERWRELPWHQQVLTHIFYLLYIHLQHSCQERLVDQQFIDSIESFNDLKEIVLKHIFEPTELLPD